MAANKLKCSDKNQITDEDREPGVVYVGHIPHGFYEKEIRQYFSQFGTVLEVKLSRSKKNGKSKGYAFIKFRYGAVAKTVAETCNNYLFFNKLLKCEYKPLGEVHEDTFYAYKWKANLKSKRQHNSAKTEDKLEDSLQKSVRRKQGSLNKLKDLGIDLKLEDVMNVPESAKRKRKINPAIVKKESGGVENVTSSELAIPLLAAKRLKRTTKTLSNDVTSDDTMNVSSKSGKPAAKPMKRATRKLSSGVKGRKLKPPSAKKAKKE